MCVAVKQFLSLLTDGCLLPGEDAATSAEFYLESLKE